MDMPPQHGSSRLLLRALSEKTKQISMLAEHFELLLRHRAADDALLSRYAQQCTSMDARLDQLRLLVAYATRTRDCFDAEALGPLLSQLPLELFQHSILDDGIGPSSVSRSFRNSTDALQTSVYLRDKSHRVGDNRPDLDDAELQRIIMRKPAATSLDMDLRSGQSIGVAMRAAAALRGRSIAEIHLHLNYEADADDYSDDRAMEAAQVSSASAVAPSLAQLIGLRRVTLTDSSDRADRGGVNVRPDSLRALRPALACLTGLEALVLTCCWREHEDNDCVAVAAALGPVLQCLPNLRELDLSYNDLSQEAVATLAPALRSLTLLTKLDLSHSTSPLGGNALELAPCLPSLANLRHLDLSTIWIAREGADALAGTLPSLKDLTRLVMSENELGPESFAALSPALKALTSLRKLSIENNKLGGDADAAAAKEFALTLLCLTSLTSIDIGNNALGPESFAALAPALRCLTDLRDLMVQRNEVKPEGMASLVPALLSLTKLDCLDLGDSALGPEGAALLAPALRNLTDLTCLSLSANDIGPVGAAALAPALGNLGRLTQLVLNANHFGSEGAIALAPALGNLGRLTQLDLADNDIGPEGDAALSAALERLANLTDLWGVRSRAAAQALSNS